MTSDLISIGGNSGASFIIPIKKPLPKIQITLILKLINKAISDKRAITLDDIRWIHAEYCFIKRKEYRSYFQDNGVKVWRCAITIQEYYDVHTNYFTSLPWFKLNLSDAILKGKLIAIPIIEID